MMKEERIKALNDRIFKSCSEKKLIFGCGNYNSIIMLIGEAPGSKEVELGQPFVGQAGKNLDEFLDILDLKREDIYITNSVKYRPTKINLKTGRLSNRTPNAKEIADFREFLFEEIDIIRPKIIVTLGNTPLKALLIKDVKIGDIHGKLTSIDIMGKEYYLYPLYHPAAIIYNRKLKEVYLNDLYELKEKIKKFQKRY